MKKVLPLYAVMMFLASCTYYSKVSNQNLYFSYRKEFNTIHPGFTVYHVADSVTNLYYRYSWSEFLFVKPQGEQEFEANAKISWKLLQNYESKLLLDSGSVIMTSKSKESVSDLVEEGVIRMKFKRGITGVLELTVADRNRNKFVRQFISIDKSNMTNRQNFVATIKERVLLQNYTDQPDTVTVYHSSRESKALTIRYYKREFPVATPPFSEYQAKPFQYKSDSLFTVTSNDSGHFKFVLKDEGFYHLQSDTAVKDGFTLFRFHSGYPTIRKADELLYPLRYITTKKEYEQMNMQQNKKAAVDDFWLNNSGGSSRAKELIRTYYNRVQDANHFFTSYLEGWKTDRGMMYIIFGAPTAVYRSSNSETWVYGEENNIRSLHFTFVKVLNPFTDNDYSLMRNENYKDSWYIAVDTWRQGRVFAD